MTARGGMKRQGGFTLLELLAAMVVGLVLIYLLSEILMLAQEGWTRSRVKSEQMLQEARAIRILTAAIANMLPPAPGDRGTPVVATPETFAFETAPMQSRANSGPMRGQISVERDSPTNMSLVMTLRSADAPGRDIVPETRHVLLSGLATAGLSYLYAGTEGLREVPETDHQVPVLVAIRWAYPQEPTINRELAVRPRIDLPEACVLDPVTASCR